MFGGYLFGIGSLLIFWLVSYLITRKVNPFALIYTENSNPVGVAPEKTKSKGEENTLSASKFQALLWTMTTLFAYTSVFGFRVLDKKEALVPELPNFPISLLVLMGLSVVTAVGSKGVTIAYKSEGVIPMESGGLATNPQGQGDLTKIQMLVWTFIAIGIYLITVVDYINAKEFILPEVDQALLVLMGVSQGAYIGNKLVSKDVTKTPRITDIWQTPVGDIIMIDGGNFGKELGTSFVQMNDYPLKEMGNEIIKWSDFRIEVKIPPTILKNEILNVKVNRDGEWSKEKLMLPLPDLEKKTYEEGLEIVEGKFALNVGQAEKVPQDTEAYWEILDQNPKHKTGYRKLKDTEIAIEIGPVMLEVPDLVGKTLSVAEDIAGTDFILSAIPQTPDVDDVISDQNPKPGDEVVYKSVITIILSKP